MGAVGTTAPDACREAMDDPDRCCHLLRPESDHMAICGYDCTGRVVHAETRCVMEGHARCFECARRRGGGVDRLIDDLTDDSPF